MESSRNSNICEMVDQVGVTCHNTDLCKDLDNRYETGEIDINYFQAYLSLANSEYSGLGII